MDYQSVILNDRLIITRWTRGGTNGRLTELLDVPDVISTSACVSASETGGRTRPLTRRSGMRLLPVRNPENARLQKRSARLPARHTCRDGWQRVYKALALQMPFLSKFKGQPTQSGQWEAMRWCSERMVFMLDLSKNWCDGLIIIYIRNDYFVHSE